MIDKPEKRKRSSVKERKPGLSWSHQHEKREEREKRKEKKGKKKTWLKTQPSTQPGPAGPAEPITINSKRVQTDQAEEDEWEELAREERMAKKLRKGDVSLEAFDKEFMSL
jgi:ATP-dependent RNA helicase DDX55/SPB4